MKSEKKKNTTQSSATQPLVTLQTRDMSLSSYHVEGTRQHSSEECSE